VLPAVQGSRLRLPSPVLYTELRMAVRPACRPDEAALTLPMSLRACAIGFT
jgi:hypothetical protein